VGVEDHAILKEARLHGNARLTHWGRRELVERILAGTSVATVAEEMNVSRATAHKWWRRFREDPTGLWWLDRSSRPHRCPNQTPAKLERQIVRLRQREKLGPVRIGARLGMPASTVHRVLTRHGLHRLAWMDRPTGELVRRYEWAQPGDLVHVDVKKLGQIPPGGGWRVHGRSATVRSTGRGWSYVHAAVDDHSRLAYAEVHDDETGPTCAAFWQRANAFFASHGITVGRVMTDNARAYYGRLFQDALAATGIAHRPIPPRRPQQNGKVERFNRTLLDEWAYVKPYRGEFHRRRQLAIWLHTYNHHRHHTALGGPPITRVDNLPGQYT
jgi:transposase InsO family protein